MTNVFFAFTLTLLAGLATGIGSCIALFSKRTNTRFLSSSLGFSAGVMIYVSFVEILSKARETLIGDLGLVNGSWLTIVSFFAGMILIGVIDRLVPTRENPHEVKGVEDLGDSHSHKKHELYRMGVFSAMAIGIHNFPEGLATFISALDNPELGIAIATAIAIHNIPEGIAVSVPIFFATGSRKKAFIYSFLSGVSEPVGALIGYLILMPFINDLIFGIIFAMVAGIMVYISLDELLPGAEKFGEHHLAIGGLMAGMFVMSISLMLYI